MQTQPTGAERRLEPRKPISAEVELITSAGTLKVELLDLSMGGAKVRTRAPAGEWGDAVGLWLPAGRSLNPVRATIVRLQPDASGVLLGLRFDPLSPSTRQTLASLVDPLS